MPGIKKIISGWKIIEVRNNISITERLNLYFLKKLYAIFVYDVNILIYRVGKVGLEPTKPRF